MKWKSMFKYVCITDSTGVWAQKWKEWKKNEFFLHKRAYDAACVIF